MPRRALPSAPSGKQTSAGEWGQRCRPGSLAESPFDSSVPKLRGGLFTRVFRMSVTDRSGNASAPVNALRRVDRSPVGAGDQGMSGPKSRSGGPWSPGHPPTEVVEGGQARELPALALHMERLLDPPGGSSSERTWCMIRRSSRPDVLASVDEGDLIEPIGARTTTRRPRPARSCQGGNP